MWGSLIVRYNCFSDGMRTEIIGMWPESFRPRIAGGLTLYSAIRRNRHSSWARMMLHLVAGRLITGLIVSPISRPACLNQAAFPNLEQLPGLPLLGQPV